MELTQLIKTLEKEIQSQQRLLDNYIEQKNWTLVHSQDQYIRGLNSALFLVRGHNIGAILSSLETT